MRVSPGFNRLFLLALLCGGCSLRHKPTSYNRIILEGDPNPTFREDPTRAGEIVRNADQPRRQTQTPQQAQQAQKAQEYQQYQQYLQSLQPQ